MSYSENKPFFPVNSDILLYREDQRQLNLEPYDYSGLENAGNRPDFLHVSRTRIDQYNGYSLYRSEATCLRRIAWDLIDLIKAKEQGSATIWFNLAYALFYLRKFVRSECILKQITETNGALFILAQAWIGHTHCGRKDFAKALKQYKEVLRVSPKNPYLRYRQAIAYRKLLAFDQAIKDLSALTEEFPSYVYGHYELGNASFDCGNMENALEHYEKAYELDKDFPAAAYQYAVTLVRSGENAKARFVFNQIVKTNPEFSFTYIGLGNLSLLKNQPKKARAFFQKTLFYDPLNDTARFNLEQVNQFLDKNQ